MKIYKLAVVCACLFAISPLYAHYDKSLYVPNNYFFTAAGVGAKMYSNALSQSYGTLPPSETIAGINNSTLDYGTEGLALSGGALWQYNRWGLKSSLEYLYLARQNINTYPFYNTSAFSSAFVDSVMVQTVIANAGIFRDLSPTLSVYADAGMGVARLAMQGIFTTNVEPLSVIETKNRTAYNFSWKAGVGAVYKLTSHLNLDAALHYASFGQANFGSFGSTPALPGGTNYIANNFSAVLLSLGIQYTT